MLGNNSYVLNGYYLNVFQIKYYEELKDLNVLLIRNALHSNHVQNKNFLIYCIDNFLFHYFGMQVDSSGLNVYWKIFRSVLCVHFYRQNMRSYSYFTIVFIYTFPPEVKRNWTTKRNSQILIASLGTTPKDT